MNRIFQFFSNRHEEVFKVLLGIAAVIIIVFLLPKEDSFRYEYELGKPWLHEELSAPFDFAVNKSNEEISSERAKVLQKVISYFKFNQDIKNNKVKSFLTDADTKWKL